MATWNLRSVEKLKNRKWSVVATIFDEILWNFDWRCISLIDTFRLLQRKIAKSKIAPSATFFSFFYYVTRNHLLATGLKIWKWFLCHLKAKRCTCLIKQLIFWSIYIPVVSDGISYLYFHVFQIMLKLEGIRNCFF